MSKIIIALVVIVLLVVGYVFVLPKTKNITQDQSSVPSTSQTSGQTAVTIENMAFSPTTLTVKVGDSVTWTNKDSFEHTVTADDGSFDTGAIGSGQSKSVTFDKAGIFTYHCNIHPNMTATIVVE